MDHFAGIISDTHGLLRRKVTEVFAGCERILHAGDVGNAAVLDGLRAIAPVTAVRGNMDRGPWTQGLKNIERVEYRGFKILIVHELYDLALQTEAPTADIVIYGHSHQPKIEYRKSILFFNPGSAGPRRFKLPISAGVLRWMGTQLQPEIITLE